MEVILLNLNTDARHSLVPQVDKPRSKFDLSHSVKTTFNVGELVPFYFEEVLPGDTMSIDTNCLVRMQPLVAPIFDDLFLDVFYFYVPNRLCWAHWKEFMGENTKSSWYPNTEYNVPHYTSSNEDGSEPIPLYSIGDYMGIPISYPDDNNITTWTEGNPDITFSKLPFRALALIYNEWFRDENIQDPILVDIDDDADSVCDELVTGSLYKVNRLHDYFSAALPQPQKGPQVMLPLGSVAPVYSSSERHDLTTSSLHFSNQLGGTAAAVGLTSGYVNLLEESNVGSGNTSAMHVDNLWADLSASQGSSINALRLALATQSFYEIDARNGSRYREILKGHFGVTSPDARMQIPEFLSYNRINININQVVQNSSSVGDSPLGRQAAYSLTADADNSFTKSFTEHGMIFGLCCARYRHTYQQGLNRRFSRRTKFDYYFPIFANLGEQPILNKEIFAYDNTANEEVFGYQEAFAEYRYHPDIVTAEMRSGISNSLDVWHLADFYDRRPRLNPKWMQENASNVDRALAITSEVSNQIFADFYIENDAVRVMPLYSIPGLPRTL